MTIYSCRYCWTRILFNIWGCDVRNWSETDFSVLMLHCKHIKTSITIIINCIYDMYHPWLEIRLHVLIQEAFFLSHNDPCPCVGGWHKRETKGLQEILVQPAWGDVCRRQSDRWKCQRRGVLERTHQGQVRATEPEANAS